MNAQHNFKPCFLSFEILNANTAKILSLWGNAEHTANPQTDDEKRLFEFFYTLNGGENFFDMLVFLITENGTILDFAELQEAPRQYTELYPADLPENWDFDGWKTALLGVLDADGKEALSKKLAEFFNTYHNGETIFERCATNYAHLPENSYLTDGDNFLQIIQQNGNTCFVFDGRDTFATANPTLTGLSAENLPPTVAKEMTKWREKFDLQNDDDRQTYINWLTKNAERSEKKAAKEAAKAEKAAERSKAKEAKQTEKAETAKAAKLESERLKKEFFTLSNTATIEEMKQWMVDNQKQIDAQTDRKEAAELYRTLKTKADNEAKQAKAAEKAETSVQDDVQTVSVPTKPGKATKAAKQPKAEAENEVVEDTEMVEA